MRLLAVVSMLLVFVSAGCRSERQRRVDAAEERLLRQAFDGNRVDLAQLDDWSIRIVAEDPPVGQSRPASRAIKNHVLTRSGKELLLMGLSSNALIPHPHLVGTDYRQGGLRLTMVWRAYTLSLGGTLPPNHRISPIIESGPIMYDIALQDFEGVFWQQEDPGPGKALPRFTAVARRVDLLGDARATEPESGTDVPPAIGMGPSQALELVQSWLRLDPTQAMLDQPAWSVHAAWIDLLIDELRRGGQLVAIEDGKSIDPIDAAAWRSFEAMRKEIGFPQVTYDPRPVDLGQTPQPAQQTIICLPQQEEAVRRILQEAESRSSRSESMQ